MVAINNEVLQRTPQHSLDASRNGPYYGRVVQWLGKHELARNTLLISTLWTVIYIAMPLLFPLATDPALSSLIMSSIALGGMIVPSYAIGYTMSLKNQKLRPLIILVTIVAAAAGLAATGLSAHCIIDMALALKFGTNDGKKFQINRLLNRDRYADYLPIIPTLPKIIVAPAA